MNESLSAGYLLEEFRPDLITDVLNHLTPDNIRVSVVGKKFSGIVDSQEKWFGTKYHSQDIPHQTLNSWKNCGLSDNLSLPPINDFIPNDLNIKRLEESNGKIPEMIRNTEFTRLWYLRDNHYLKPKVYYKFKFTKY